MDLRDTFPGSEIKEIPKVNEEPGEKRLTASARKRKSTVKRKIKEINPDLL